VIPGSAPFVGFVLPAELSPEKGLGSRAADVVSDHGMTMVGWDDSGGDWATTNAGLVARRILGHLRPGSIILLHDGSDGDVTSNRTVVVKALPRPSSSVSG
jgi:peptidoglycan/xylan/chitin deacetylase (PgdA/CDA1 family)